MVEAVRMLTVAVPNQDFSDRKLKCPFFIMVYKSLFINVFTTFYLILNKICGRKSATWPWHTAASPNAIVSYKDKYSLCSITQHAVNNLSAKNCTHVERHKSSVIIVFTILLS
jgi:hypothetical protein